MARKSTVDWAAVEHDYRLGLMNDSELAKSHRVSRGSMLRRAAREGWTRDLAREVRARTNAALITKPGERVSESPPVSDIDAAVQTNVEVITRHRKLAAAGRTATEKLLARINDVIGHEDEIVAAIVEGVEGGQEGQSSPR